MTDLLGFGSNAANVVTTRPTDTRIFGSVDTYPKDCSSPGAGDGTAIPASWAAGLLAQMRNLIRGNGQTAVPADIVPVDNTDDNMLLKAIQHLIQRGQPCYGVDTGAVNVLVAALAPVPAELKAGMRFVVKVGHTNTIAPTINFNSFGAKSIIRPDGATLRPFDITINQMLELIYDGTNMQAQGLRGRTRLGANLIVYVSPTGDDTANDGLTSATPFQTRQLAWDYVQKNFDLNGYGVTFLCAGNFTDAVNTYGSLIGQGAPSSVLWLGDATTPSNVTVIPTGQACWSSFGSSYTVRGFKMSGATNFGLKVDLGGHIEFGDVDFGAMPGTGGHIFVRQGSVGPIGNYTISGGCGTHISVGGPGAYFKSYTTTALTVTLSGTPAFSIAFATANDLGEIMIAGVSFAGSATGIRYFVAINGAINGTGGNVNFFPGNAAGSGSPYS